MTLHADAHAVYAAALRAVDPADAVQRALTERPPPEGPVTVLGAGKAVVGMVRGAQAAWGAHRLSGHVVAPHPAELGATVRVSVGDHPVPTERSLTAGEALLAAARALPADAAVLGLWSGGASALAVAPTCPLADLVAGQRRRTAAGADIHELNAWRIAHSRLKGGRLRQAAPASTRWTNLVISDVLGDDPALVGSGPAITPDSPGEVVSRRDDAVAGARAEAWGLRYAVTVLSTTVSGDAAEAGRRLGHALSLQLPGQPPLCLLAAGEPVVAFPPGVEVPPGGRMQHAALAAALAIDGTEAVVLAAGTDGRDGPTDAAGALVDGRSAGRIRAAGIDPEAALASRDSARALAACEALIPARPTGTNVGDLLIGLVGPTPRAAT